MNKNMNRIIQIFLLIFTIQISQQALLGQSQQDLRETLFSETDKLLAQAKSEQASILSPVNFANAMNRYNQALEDFKEKKQIKKIESKLQEVQEKLNAALKTAKLGKIAFATTLKAREDALNANATEYAPDIYNEAEDDFISATKKLERNDVKGAKSKIPEIDNLYRQAELNAIKVSIIGTVRNLMREARDIDADDYTPITYANALKYLNEAESILNSNRRSESSAKEKAEKAEIEAKHAIYLTKQIKRLKKNENEWENFILDREIYIEQIAHELGFEAHFDEGLDKPLQEIYNVTKLLQQEKRQLIKENQEKDKEIEKLSTELQKYRQREQGLQAELEEKQYRLELKRKREELIASVEEMFSSSEAVVLRKGNDIIIRLIGLTFPSGKSIIKPEFFNLLATLQRAVRKFNNSPITIEGHTDAIGDDRYNENLSYERAIAVKQYLLANMGLDDSRITAVGYGETSPIASNETASGRAQNRRIDVVISFGQENL